MVEIPRKPVKIDIAWNDPDEPPEDHDPAIDGEWKSTGSWSITVEGHGEIITDTQWSNDDGFLTLVEAVGAAEKWALDRRLEITTFGVQMRALDSPLRGHG